MPALRANVKVNWQEGFTQKNSKKLKRNKNDNIYVALKLQIVKKICNLHHKYGKAIEKNLLQSGQIWCFLWPKRRDKRNESLGFRVCIIGLNNSECSLPEWSFARRYRRCDENSSAKNKATDTTFWRIACLEWFRTIYFLYAISSNEWKYKMDIGHTCHSFLENG